MRIRHLMMISVLLAMFAVESEACPFRRMRCRIIQRQSCQAGFIVSEIPIQTITPNTLPGVIPVQPSTTRESAPATSDESGPPAPSLELVKSSAIEETPFIFSIVDEPEFVLIDSIDFKLCTEKKETIDLSSLESVKAYQDETPTLNLSGLGQAADVPTPKEPAKIAMNDEVSSSDFALTDEVPEEEYPAPASEISGSEIEYKVGDLIELSVKPISDKPDGLISVDYTWTILPSIPSRVWPDKSKILFGTGPQDGTYVVILNTSYVFGERNPQGNIESVVQKTAVTMANVKVGGGVVTVSPGGLSGLSRLAYEWTNDVAITDSYNQPQLMADAAKLAGSFRSIAGEIQSGTLTDVNSILRRTKENNDATIENRNEWLAWFTKMSEYLQTSYNNGSIRDTEDFYKAWMDIANGLDAASRG